MSVSHQEMKIPEETVATSDGVAVEERNQLRSAGHVLGVGALLCGLVIAFSIWSLAGAVSAQSCVQKVLAQYPAVPVSAFTGPQTTAMKLSFVTERQKALESCN